ncbi:diguanylate cyclase [Acaryochloris sp. IP29b_bin.148]|uniref:diguanylate cyclase domain-containing protein n=1 Tax=Acaryochloris sp. IP29b_bin.148 TaxID=2969218 RepID=UPI00262A0C74|nr:diguanylate cyclase [Acaryochloris sp. IP29b_bin.148]
MISTPNDVNRDSLDTDITEYHANIKTEIASPATSVLPSDILIVDDTLENLRLLSNMLAIQGYSIRKATGGEMALNSVDSLLPDLILLDILMPDLNGYEVCIQLKKNPQTANIPIIFLSALDDPLDKVKAFEVGGVDYLTKPFQLEEVLARVHNQLSLKDAQEKVLALNAQLQQWVLDQNRQLHQANSQLLETSNTDYLTTLPNRISFLTRLEQSLFLAKMDESYQFAVLYLDCDRFRSINQTFGYSVGDKLLKQIAMGLTEVIQPDDMLARIGGDEFAILLNTLTDESSVNQLAEKVFALLEQPFQIQGNEITIAASIGIDYGSAKYAIADNILKNAEIAMYSAKDKGEGHYTIYNPLIQGGGCK